MGTLEPLNLTETKLKRIAWLSSQDHGKEFECLMHLFNYESLKDCFHHLDKNKAVGIDGIDKASYELNLEHNIKELIKKMRDMAYRPGPVREVLIPKEGKPGATRPLGISNLEDKIVQMMMQKVLESIYEPTFLECSYGFRPGRGCHDAIKALHQHLFRNKIQTVIDIDLKNFFGTIDHKLLEDILKERIKDPKFMRYINRMFKSGVLAEGEMKYSEEGVPQGSICSPALANIFAHYAIDVWIEEMVKPRCKGKVGLLRYADDAVICCEYDTDAQKIREALAKRLNKFKLQLNEEKTRLVSFDKQRFSMGEEQGTFDFLGFTFYLGKSRTGYTIPKLKTKAKAMKTKLNRVTEWIRQQRNKLPLKEIWKTFRAKLRGHIQYYGVSFNSGKVTQFIREATRIIHKWLNRRSQRKSFSWEKFKLFIEKNPLPNTAIVHRLF
jgi:group II intron reverse transcriptase/maturase